MGARLTAALLAGRAATGLSRRLGRGGGTVIAGHVVPRIAPCALSTITRRLRLGSVLVSGTNGKTTTSRLIAHTLAGAGVRPLHNRAGANLVTGLVAAVVQQSDLRGHPLADVGLFEVDEATLPAALREVRPRTVLLTNIFRDQLDRYGEVHFVAETWQAAARQLDPATTLILNADDPLVSNVGRHGSANALHFGVSDLAAGTAEVPHAADARLCPSCGIHFSYTVAYYGHLGHYHCPGCGTSRPQPDVVAHAVESLGVDGTRVLIQTPRGELDVRLGLPGLYNVYNALAATATCLTLGLELESIKRGLETISAAFGRLERVALDDRQLFLALVKNPVGFTEVLRTILGPRAVGTVLIAINDRFADGTDISWLWDVEIELLADRVEAVVCAGTRAADMAVRLKYALVAPDRIHVEPDPDRALNLALARSRPGETVFILPTYTAMLEIRDVLRRRGAVSGFWVD